MKSLPYFAFGSNMSKKQLKERDVSWNGAFSASLDDYRLVFNKKAISGDKSFANIEKEKGGKVHGIIYYGLTEKDYDTLDIYEGVQKGQYQRKIINIWQEDKEIVKAITYMAGEEWIDKGGALKPSKDYIDKLWEGKDYLPLDYQQMLKNVEVKEGGKYGDYLSNSQKIQEQPESKIEVFSKTFPL